MPSTTARGVSSGISYRAALSTRATAAVKRPLILYSQHVTMCYASVRIAEWSWGSRSMLQYVQIIVKQLLGGCFLSPYDLALAVLSAFNQQYLSY